MANNVRQGFGNSPWDVYLAFPPVTRTLVTSFAATALVTSLGLIDGRLLVLSWPAVFSKYFQVLTSGGLVRHFACENWFLLRMLLLLILLLCATLCQCGIGTPSRKDVRVCYGLASDL